MSAYATALREHRRGAIVNLCLRRDGRQIDAGEALGWLRHLAYDCNEAQVREDMHWLVSRRFARYVRTGEVPSIRLGVWQ